MASSIGTAWIQIKPSLSGISKDIENELSGASVSGGNKMQSNLRSVFKGLGSNVEETFSGAFDKVASSAKKIITAGVGGTIALLGSQLDNAFSRADTLNNFPKVMANFGVAASDATQMVKELDLGVRGLPTSLNSIVALAQGFVPITKNTEEATKTALALNNAVLAGGAPIELQTAALEQFRQALSKGVPDLQDWKSIEVAMPAQLRQIAIALGIGSGKLKSYKQNGLGVYQAMKDGFLTMDDFNKALMDLNNTGINGLPNFAQQAKNATTGIVSNFANMRTAITRTLANVVNGIPNFTESIAGVGKAIEGTINGTLSQDKAAKLIDNFFKGVGGAFTKVFVSLLPVILSSLTSLVTNIADTISSVLSNQSNSYAIISGFVKLFVAIAKAGGQIAIALLPVIPVIIGEFASAIAKPENAGPIAAGLGILLGFSVLKTVSGNLKDMIGKSISNLFTGIIGKNKAADAAADSINNLSNASKNAPKSFTFGESIMSFFKNIGQALSGVAEAVISPLKTLATGASQILTTVLTGLGEGLAGFLKALSNPQLLLGALVFAGAAAAVALAILMIGGAIGAVSPGLASFTNDVLLPLGKFLADTFVTVITSVTAALVILTVSAIVPLVSAVSGGLTSAFNAIGGVIGSAGDSISKVITSISTGIVNVINSIANLLRSVGGQDWYGTGYGITRNFSAGLIDGLIDLLQDSLNKIINNLLNIPGIGDALKSIGLKSNLVNLSGLKLGRRANGGPVFGMGSSTSDSIPTALSNGEYVIRAAAAKKVGYANLDRINSSGDVGGGVSMGDIIINGYNKDPRELAQEISKIIALSQKRVMG